MAQVAHTATAACGEKFERAYPKHARDAVMKHERTCKQCKEVKNG